MLFCLIRLIVFISLIYLWFWDDTIIVCSPATPPQTPCWNPCLEETKYFLTAVEFPLKAWALISSIQATVPFVADNVTTAASYASDVSPARYQDQFSYKRNPKVTGAYLNHTPLEAYWTWQTYQQIATSPVKEAF